MGDTPGRRKALQPFTAALTANEMEGRIPMNLRRAAEIMGWDYGRLLDLAKEGKIRTSIPPGGQRGYRVFWPEFLEDVAVKPAKR